MSEAQTADPIPEAPADEEEVEGLNEVELKNQASRCPCRGSNDMCVCQNVPDAHTRDERGLPRAHHPDDEAVDRFAVAMKAKLAQKRAEGRGGWENKDECGQGYLSELLAEHVRKGDPVDVANLAMMLHQRGERIDAAALRRSTETDKPGVREAVTGRIKPEIIRSLREWAEFEQDVGNVEQGAAIDIILDWYDRALSASSLTREETPNV